MKQQLNEVQKLQKMAGIVKESFDGVQMEKDTNLKEASATTFKVKDTVHFINRDEDGFDDMIETGEVVKIGPKGVKITAFSSSGWNSDEDYIVKPEDILAVEKNGKIYKVR